MIRSIIMPSSSGSNSSRETMFLLKTPNGITGTESGKLPDLHNADTKNMIAHKMGATDVALRNCS